MRQEFEKLPEIEKALRLGVVWSGEYYEEDKNFVYQTADWVNGALYAYQEQQKKVLGIMLDNLGDEFNDLRSPSYDAMLYALREIKELLNDPTTNQRQ